MFTRFFLSAMMCCGRVGVLDANRARDGRAVRPAHLRTLPLPRGGARIRLDVRYHWSQKHLPIIAFKHAA